MPTIVAAQSTDATEPPFNPVDTTDITAASNPNNFDTPEIMAALYTPHSDLVLLSAHRGFHALANSNQAPKVAENSKAAIGYAAESGWEMIELDVKLTSDGTPILSHDRTWGREWCGLSSVLLGPQVNYDPFTPPGQSARNDYTNPQSPVLLSQIRGLIWVRLY